MVFLTKDIVFPPVETASPEGIVAIGGDLSVERLILAYKSGIFPWFEEGSPILWWSPDPRMVLFPDKLKISKSLKSFLKKEYFTVTFNTNFKEVIKSCATIKRKGQKGTWITQQMIEAYCKLNDLGYAKSVEVWKDNELVGGLYGVNIGSVFCGESMFSKVSNASKVGFVALVNKLKQEKYKLIDCQIYTQYLASFGAEEIPREVFLSYLR